MIEQLQQRHHALLDEAAEAKLAALISQFCRDLSGTHFINQPFQMCIVRQLVRGQPVQQFTAARWTESENLARALAEILEFFYYAQLFYLTAIIAAVATGIATGYRETVAAFPDAQGVDADTDFLTELQNLHFCPRQNSIYLNNINKKKKIK
jgi:hypothetical protein